MQILFLAAPPPQGSDAIKRIPADTPLEGVQDDVAIAEFASLLDIQIDGVGTAVQPPPVAEISVAFGPDFRLPLRAPPQKSLELGEVIDRSETSLDDVLDRELKPTTSEASSKVTVQNHAEADGLEQRRETRALSDQIPAPIRNRENLIASDPVISTSGKMEDVQVSRSQNAEPEMPKPQPAERTMFELQATAPKADTKTKPDRPVAKSDPVSDVLQSATQGRNSDDPISKAVVNRTNRTPSSQESSDPKVKSLTQPVRASIEPQQSAVPQRLDVGTFEQPTREIAPGQSNPKQDNEVSVAHVRTPPQPVQTNLRVSMARNVKDRAIPSEPSAPVKLTQASKLDAPKVQFSPADSASLSISETRVDVSTRIFTEEPKSLVLQNTDLPRLGLSPTTSAVSVQATQPTLSPPSIASQIAVALQGSDQADVEIKLSPEELGSVRIVLSSKDAGITVLVAAERPETLELMRRNAHELSASFEDLGFEDTSFTFEQQNSSADQESRSEIYTNDEQNSGRANSAKTVVTLLSEGMDLRL